MQVFCSWWVGFRAQLKAERFMTLCPTLVAAGCRGLRTRRKGKVGLRVRKAASEGVEMVVDGFGMENDTPGLEKKRHKMMDIPTPTRHSDHLIPSIPDTHRRFLHQTLNAGLCFTPKPTRVLMGMTTSKSTSNDVHARRYMRLRRFGISELPEMARSKPIYKPSAKRYNFSC